MKSYASLLFFLMGLVSISAVVNAAGRKPPLPTVPPVVISTASAFEFRLVEDDAGGFFLLWTEPDAEGAWQVRGLHAGSPEARVKVFEQPLARQVPDVMHWHAFPDGQHRLVVAWNQLGDIHVQKYDASGSPLWERTRETLTASTSTRTGPIGAADAAGGVYVVWPENQLADRPVLMAQHLNARGDKHWAQEGIRVSYKPSMQQDHGVWPDRYSGIVVSWRDSFRDSSTLPAQRIDFQGTRLWGLDGISVISPYTSLASKPKMIPLPDGGAVIAWPRAIEGKRKIMAQRINAAGIVAYESRGKELAPGPASQWRGQLSEGTASFFWLSWENQLNSGLPHITAARILMDGTLAPEGPVILSPSPAAAQGGHDADSREGALSVAWMDTRSGRTGIYFQQLNADGQAQLGIDGISLTEGIRTTFPLKVLMLDSQRTVVAWKDRPTSETWSLHYVVYGSTTSPQALSPSR